MQQVGVRLAVHSPVNARDESREPRFGRSSGRTLRRAQRRTWGRLVKVLLVLGLSGGLGFGAFATRSAWTSAAYRIPTLVQQVSVAVGFGLDEVVVTGHRFTPDEDIFDALDLAHNPTMTALQLATAKVRIEKLPWIATITFTRVFPGRLDVRVSERRPKALWLGPKGLMLIDDTGRSLSPAVSSQWPTLPRVSGSGAADAAPTLLETLAHYPTLAERMELATRIDERRWRLTLKDDVVIELPSEGEATALAAFDDSTRAAPLVSQRSVIIDLRSKLRFAVRPKAGS